MTPLINKSTLLLIASASLALIGGIQAQTYNFTAFETGGVSNINDLAPIHLSATLSQNGNNVDVTISNDSVLGDSWITSEVPTITKIAFDDDSGLLPAPTFANSPPNVVFGVSNSVNIPGSNNISFDTTYGFRADPPPTTTGIDPNEQFVVTFADTDLADLVQSFNSGETRIAVHVQQIGRNDDSASFVTTVPEPSSALLLSLAGIATIIRRRR